MARSQPTAWDEKSLLWLEAELARAEGRWPEALSAFEELSRIYQRLDWRWRWARAPGLGRCLRSTRRARGLAEGGIVAVGGIFAGGDFWGLCFHCNLPHILTARCVAIK